jgi:hypothetical protein
MSYFVLPYGLTLLLIESRRGAFHQDHFIRSILRYLISQLITYLKSDPRTKAKEYLVQKGIPDPEVVAAHLGAIGLDKIERLANGVSLIALKITS